MDADPNEYFNFGFDRKTYERYLMLIILRRSQRINIFNKIKSSHLEKSVETRKLLSSDAPKYTYHPHYSESFK